MPSLQEQAKEINTSLLILSGGNSTFSKAVHYWRSVPTFSQNWHLILAKAPSRDLWMKGGWSTSCKIGHDRRKQNRGFLCIRAGWIAFWLRVWSRYINLKQGQDPLGLRRNPSFQLLFVKSYKNHWKAVFMTWIGVLLLILSYRRPCPDLLSSGTLRNRLAHKPADSYPTDSSAENFPLLANRPTNSKPRLWNEISICRSLSQKAMLRTGPGSTDEFRF